MLPINLKFILMTKILVADDHAIVRYGTMQLISKAFPAISVSDADSLDEVVQRLKEEIFDLLILDINLPGGNSLQMLDVVRLKQPTIKILVFSGYDEQLYAVRYLQYGADGYLNKNSPEGELEKAVKLILNNEKYLSNSIKECLINGTNGNKPSMGRDPLKNLSNREMEVLQSLVAGMSLAEIGIKLNLGISTVSTYKQRVFEKLNISNMVQLIEKVQVYNIEAIKTAC
jgi:two-component system, NarL family, invasion response regulator UvrY